MRRLTVWNPGPTWVGPYLSFDGQILCTVITLLPSNWTPCHVCRQAGENITHKGHWGASLGLEVRWPKSCWISLYSPYEWCMAGGSLVQCGERERVRESEWTTAAIEANEHWSRVLQLHWPQLVPSSGCPEESRKWPYPDGKVLMCVRVFVCVLSYNIYDFFFPCLNYETVHCAEQDS